jgi:hypothetical protein
MTDIKQLFSTNIYNALTGAHSPSSSNVFATIADITGGISGLTTNYITKATSSTTIGNSLLFDNGTNVGLNNTTPFTPFHMNAGGGPSSAGDMNTGLAISVGLGGAAINMGVFDNGSMQYGWIQTAYINNANVVRNMSINSMGGNIGLGYGITSPTAQVHLAPGASSTGAAPLKFSPGTNLAAVENGAMEYNGTHLYFTTGGARYQIDQQGGGGLSGSGSASQLAYFTASTVLTSNANFYFDGTDATYSNSSGGGFGVDNSGGVDYISYLGDYQNNNNGTYIEVNDSLSSVIFHTSQAVSFSNIALTGSLALNMPPIVVSGSTSGTSTFAQPFAGTNYKVITIYAAALVGTASYTFPISFTNTPVVVITSAANSGQVTTLTTTSVTITGSGLTGYIEIHGF